MTTMHNGNQQPSEPLFYKSRSTTGMQPLGRTPLAQGPYLPSYNDMHIILPISQAEAQTGTMRTLNFASGRQVTIAVPAHVSHGQVLRLEGQGELSPFGGPAGALVMTVTITPPGASVALPPIQSMRPPVPPPLPPQNMRAPGPAAWPQLRGMQEKPQQVNVVQSRQKVPARGKKWYTLARVAVFSWGTLVAAMGMSTFDHPNVWGMIIFVQGIAIIANGEVAVRRTSPVALLVATILSGIALLGYALVNPERALLYAVLFLPPMIIGVVVMTLDRDARILGHRENG